MRDGVDLVADLYLPPGEGPFPTLVYRIRGSRSSSFITGAIMLNPLVAAERGFAVLIQEVRGRGGSGGEWRPFVHEADDGWDTLDWATAQPWCNGRIGTYGTAYTGIAALELAATGHPALEAVVVVVSGVSPHDGWIYTAGAFELGWNTFWSYLTAGDSLKRLSGDADKGAIGAALQSDMSNPMEQMERMPISHRPALESVSPHYWTWLEHDSYDEYWQKLDVIAMADRIEARVLNVTGWWDNFQHGHLELYRALAERSPNGADQRLVIGPWDHFTYVNIVPTMAGARNFGPAGVAGPVVTEPAALAWFDRWLADAAESPLTRPGVRWFASGSDRWIEGDEWPPPSSDMHLHLGEPEAGGWRPGSRGRLAVESSRSNGSAYTYHPSDPTPTIGGRLLMPTVVAPGVQDVAALVERSDTLVFETPALDQSVEIAGNVRLELRASANSEDIDFSAVLSDVGPDGRWELVADGFIRCRHRNGFDREDWLTPGDPFDVTVDLWDVAWTFEPGHRIGLIVASASFPRFDRNLGSKVSSADATLDGVEPIDVTIHHDPQHPSRLILPIR
jgi:putative CocE/NonD family hydrolase